MVWMLTEHRIFLEVAHTYQDKVKFAVSTEKQSVADLPWVFPYFTGFQYVSFKSMLLCCKNFQTLPPSGYASFDITMTYWVHLNLKFILRLP